MLDFSDSGQTQPSLSPAAAAAFVSPTLSDHDRKRPRQGGTVHVEHLAELARGHLPGAPPYFEDRRLRRRQPNGAQHFLIEMREGPRPTTEAPAPARQFRQETWPMQDRCIYT